MKVEFINYLKECFLKEYKEFDDAGFEDYVFEAFEGFPPEGMKVIITSNCGDGAGEDCEAVAEWNGLYFKAVWKYYSYLGPDIDSFIENIKHVQAKEKVVTVYE